jgi:hypothetical protein
LIDVVGVAGTLTLIRYAGDESARFPFKTQAAFCLFYALGWIWATLLGEFGPRQQMAFWPTLFLFGYALAGLWFGVAFSGIGLRLAALIFAAYVWSGAAFSLWMAALTAGGFALWGLWMRRA